MTFNCLILISILSLNLSSLFGQDKIVFAEKFKANNKNHWTIINDKEFSVQISNKSISFKKVHKNRENNFCLWYKKNISTFQSENNFKISFDAIIQSADDIINGFDFQWGMLEDSTLNSNLTTSLYQLDFSLKDVRLSKFDNISGWTYFDSETYHKKDTKRFFLKLGKKYKYSIEQIDSNLKVSINNIVVYEFKINKLFGHDIGVQQCLKSSWKLKNLVIRQ